MNEETKTPTAENTVAKTTEALKHQQVVTADLISKAQTVRNLISEQQERLQECQQEQKGGLPKLYEVLAGYRVDKLNGLNVTAKLKAVQVKIDNETAKLEQVNSDRQQEAAGVRQVINALAGKETSAQQAVASSKALEDAAREALSKALALEYAEDYLTACRKALESFNHIQALEKLLECKDLQATGVLEAGYFQLRLPKLNGQSVIDETGGQFDLARLQPDSLIPAPIIETMSRVLDIEMPLFQS